jgi:predicted heme/steroid binding protein
MDGDLKWVIGIAVSMVLAFGTAMVGAFRNVSAKIANLHGRVDDVKEKYVRRDDLDGHIQRLDGNVRDLREEMRENHRQLLEVLSRRS